MSERSLPVSAVLAAGVGMGIAGDHLLRAPGALGLNLLLLFLGLVASVRIVLRSGGSPLSREASTWLAVGVLTGAALVWRGSELLRLVTFLAACTAFALPALHGGRAWVRHAAVTELLEAVVGAGLRSAFGGLRLFSRDNRQQIGTDTSRRAAGRVAQAAIGGLLLAGLPLIVFGALFISADPVFAGIVEDIVRIDLHKLGSHVLVAAILSWLTCGYLVGFTSGTRLDGIRELKRASPSLRIPEVATALGLVSLLFLGFVTVQFRDLFGGADWVEVTSGLTYAAYAREGFFQLVAAVTLSVPWLLAADGLLKDRSTTARSLFGGLAGLHLLLLLAIVASAIQRMLAYQAAYGMTELRYIVTAVLVWLTLTVLWFGATVLRGRRESFAFGALATAFALVGGLQILNPAEIVARSNLDRVVELGADLDVEYLGSLGSDAAPVVVARLGELPEEGRCAVTDRLLRLWGPERPADWRSWNWSESRARDAVSAELGALRSVAGDCVRQTLQVRIMAEPVLAQVAVHGRPLFCSFGKSVCSHREAHSGHTPLGAGGSSTCLSVPFESHGVTTTDLGTSRRDVRQQAARRCGWHPDEP